MSNSIRRPRKHPRVTSCNFRALWWLVARVAYVHICCGHATPAQRQREKWRVMRAPLWRLIARAERIMFFNEARRYYP